MGSETVLVPVRFLVTFTHLLACVMVSYTSDENVMRGLGLDHWFGTHSSSVEAKAEIDWLAASATALCIVDLVGLMLGLGLRLFFMLVLGFGGRGVGLEMACFWAQDWG